MNCITGWPNTRFIFIFFFIEAFQLRKKGMAKLEWVCPDIEHASCCKKTPPLRVVLEGEGSWTCVQSCLWIQLSLGMCRGQRHMLIPCVCEQQYPDCRNARRWPGPSGNKLQGETRWRKTYKWETHESYQIVIICGPCLAPNSNKLLKVGIWENFKFECWLDVW